jgi:hypothetical protein
LSGIHGLLAKCRTTAPTEIELSALAALLHSFYTGVENIFKRVAVELDGEPVRGDSWHRELLLRMKSPTAHRPALLSEELHDTLNEKNSINCGGCMKRCKKKSQPSPSR